MSAKPKTLRVMLAAGETVSAAVVRNDGRVLDASTGAFVPVGEAASLFGAMTEHGSLPGFYQLVESRTVWQDGWYTALFYVGNSGPVPAPPLQRFEVSGDGVLGTLALSDQALVGAHATGRQIGELEASIVPLKSMLTRVELMVGEIMKTLHRGREGVV